MIVSRATELSRLDAVLAGLAAGRGEALVLHGEAGIGKTTLLEALAERAGSTATVVRACGAETEAELAFSALSDLLEPVLGVLRAAARGSAGSGGSGGDALTPQEWRVAEAVRRGASNRAVAAELFLSPKTVEFHLHQIYRKLGVHSRTQLIAALADRQEAEVTGRGARRAPA